MPALLDEFLEALPRRFQPEKAGEWKATLYLDTGEGEGYTLAIEAGSCRIEKGRQGEPTAEITGKREVWERLAEGCDTFKNAFVRGDLRTTKSTALLRFEKCFDLTKDLLEESESGERPGLRRELVGQTVRGKPVRADPEKVRAFAEATGDDCPAYLDPESGIVPPVFPITFMRPIFVKLLTEQETGGDVQQMVHSKQDMRFLAPIRPGDLVEPSGKVEGVTEEALGDTLTIEQELRTSGEVAVEMTTTLFFRAPTGSRRRTGGKRLMTRPHSTGRSKAILFDETVTVTDDMPILYAEASGDRNPIHTDRDFARSAGFRDVLLQGTCTMALAGRSIVKACAGNDPRRLARLKVRFARPVFPGDELTTIGWVEKDEDGQRGLGFEVANQDGKRVLIDGLAVVRE